MCPEVILFVSDLYYRISSPARFLECRSPTFNLSLLPRGIRFRPVMFDSLSLQDGDKLIADETFAVIRRHYKGMESDSQRIP
jgi:hypothetical protein